MSTATKMLKPTLKSLLWPMVEGYTFLADGRLVNLAGERGQGHPAEIMDMSFAMQALSVKYLVNNKLEMGIYKTPDETDISVAELKLKAMKIEIDHYLMNRSNILKTGKKEPNLINIFIIFFLKD